MNVKLISFCKKSICFIGLIVLIVSCTKPKENKVLIIGIDGCRPDALQNATTNNIDSLWKNGSYTFSAKTDEISSSGICWTSMLTGVWHEKHNVLTNRYSNPNISEFPHFFRRVKQFNPELKTYSVVQWEPIHRILQQGDADYAKSFKTDEAVTKDVIARIQEDDIDVLFVQFDDVDHAGHAYGFDPQGEKYLNSIHIADTQVGKIVRTLKQRNNYKNENWLVIITTDHGGSNTGHGLNIKEHTTIFYIVSGEHAGKGEIKNTVNVTDVCITAMQHLGLSVKDVWKLDGKISGLNK